MEKNKARALAAAFVAAATFAAFLPVLRNGLLNWDDNVLLSENLHFRGFGGAQLGWMFSTILLGKYQPLAWLTFAADYSVWGMNPAGYHLTALLLHCANAVLYYFLAVRLLGLALAPITEARLRLAGAVSALAFSLHPLRVESVAWAADRGGLLAVFFYLLAVLLFLERRTWLCAGAFLLSLLSKAEGITFPAVLLLLDAYPLRRKFSRGVFQEKIPIALLALIFACLGLTAQASTSGLVSMDLFGIPERLAQALFGGVFYLEKTILPSRLSPLYQLVWPLEGATVLINAALAVFLTAAVVIWRRPGVLAVWAYHWLALLPVIGLVKLGIPEIAAADRYSYLPALGTALLAGAAFSRFGGKKSLAVAAAVAAALGALSWRQAGSWRDSKTLWSRAVELDPGCYLCRAKLAEALRINAR